MSLTKNDRNFRSKSGKPFPNEGEYGGFAAAITAALKAEFGGSAAAVKSVSRLTGSTERTVRNWFEGKNGPTGQTLVELIKHSDAVLNVILILSERRELMITGDLLAIRSRMRPLMELLDKLHPD